MNEPVCSIGGTDPVSSEPAAYKSAEEVAGRDHPIYSSGRCLEGQEILYWEQEGIGLPEIPSRRNKLSQRS